MRPFLRVALDEAMQRIVEDLNAEVKRNATVRPRRLFRQARRDPIRVPAWVGRPQRELEQA